MKTHHQLLGFAMRCPVAAHALSQRCDVTRIVVVVVDESELGQQPCFQPPGVDGIEHAGCRGARVLGIGWKQEYACDALGFERVQLGWNIVAAVAHGVFHEDVFPMRMEGLLQG